MSSDCTGRIGQCRCDICSGKVREEEFLASMRAKIAQYQFGVLGVGSFNGPMNLLYTVGLSNHELPELVMLMAVSGDLMQKIVNTIGYGWLQTKNVELSERTDILKQRNDGVLPLRLDAVDPRLAVENYCHQLPQVLGIAVPHRMVQVVLPDENLRFPDQPGYDQERYPQSLLPPSMFIEKRVLH